VSRTSSESPLTTWSSPGFTLAHRSLDNVEIIQQFLGATTRKDVDGMVALVHDDLVFVPITAAMEGRTYAGHAGVRQFMEDLDAYWEFFDTIQEEWHDLGDRVVALGSWHARGRASGVEIHGQPAVWLAHIREGKIARWRTYTDVAEGLQAAGLSEHEVRFSPG
jgi:ketosteroid isomerase-like protein